MITEFTTNPEFTSNDWRNNGEIIFKVNGSKRTMYYTCYPTANCQLRSIGKFTQLFECSKEDKIELFKLIVEKIKLKGKLLLIDIHNSQHTALLEIITEGKILTKTPYTSTNGSEMCLYILKNL